MKRNIEVRPNAIVAMTIISESELAKVMDYDFTLEEKNPTKFRLLMHSLGMDITMPIMRQDAIQHRNRFNEIVVCSRWVGYSRIDSTWINSGYASKEAIDKASGSRLVEDVYRMRGETEDMQERMESRDKYYESKDEE